MTDTELLTRFVSENDRAALTSLVYRYEKLVWSVCTRALSNRQDVEDAFQTTFLTFARNAQRIRKPKSLGNWLFGVARRTALQIRSRRTQTLLADVVERDELIADERESALDAIMRQHKIDLVDQTLNAMQEKYRTPLILKYFSGLTAIQIADQLDLSVAAVEGRIRRARQKLKTGLRTTESFGNVELLMCAPVIGLVIRPEFAEAVLAQCVATAPACFSASVANVTLNAGMKMMICKTICIAGISMLIAVGGFLHLGPGHEPSTPNLVATNFSQAASGSEAFVSVAVEADEEDECCFGVCCHQHLAFMHKMIEIHVEHFHNCFGFCQCKE